MIHTHITYLLYRTVYREIHVMWQGSILTIKAPPWIPVAMAFMMKEPSRLLVKSDTVPVESEKSELKAADTWFRICAADVLYLERDAQ